MDGIDFHYQQEQEHITKSGLTAQAGQSLSSTFWQKPHPLFVIILVGTDEVPFGIHKDVLCAQSPFFLEDLATLDQNGLELVCKLPDTDTNAFGCLQSFIYTGEVYRMKSGDSMPDFSVLLRVWKLAKKLKMAHLQTNLLNCMLVHRQKGCMPSVQNIRDAWGNTKEGCSLRIKLIDWIVEHMRDSPEELAKHLPKEILGELCMAMARAPANHTPKVRPSKKRKRNNGLPGDENEPGISKERAPKHSDVVDIIQRDLNFCRVLIGRMHSSNGYWARFNKPFKEPVDPDLEKMPHYFKVITCPMDLTTIKTKIDKNDYENANEFEADIRQMFQNCYTYWTKTDPIFKLCEDFETAFNKSWTELEGVSRGNRSVLPNHPIGRRLLGEGGQYANHQQYAKIR